MKRSIFTFGLCFVLFATLFLSNIILAQDGGSYDPWIDTNDDGIINVQDLQILAVIYGTSGTPINKTALLLELAERIDSLNATLLMDYYNKTNCDNLFALMGHIHDGRYYTEGECISLFAALGHNHDDRYYTEIESNSLFALLIHYHDDRYYTEGECNSLFASAVHSHLGSDIQGGFPRFEDIYLGNAEGNSIIYFYEDGVPTGEYIYWQDAGDRFYVSDDMHILGDAYILGTVTMSTKTRYYTVSGSAWLPMYDHYNFGRWGSYIYTNTAGDTYWRAPVNLPHGAVVTEVTAWVWDQNVVEDIMVQLHRTQATTGDSWLMASVTSSGGSPSYQAYSDTTIGSPTIDNQNNAYSLSGVMRTGDIYHRLGQVRITYTITEPLP